MQYLTVSVFPSDQKQVTVSGHARQLINQAEPLSPLLVVGNRFTLEAAALLRNHAQYFYCLDNSFWTDTTFENIKISIAKKR